ncbi:hypothetical protein FKM82_025555 [Ascaphus truei]
MSPPAQSGHEPWNTKHTTILFRLSLSYTVNGYTQTPPSAPGRKPPYLTSATQLGAPPPHLTQRSVRPQTGLPQTEAWHFYLTWKPGRRVRGDIHK